VTRSLRLAGQAAAIVVVGALLVVLVWRLTHQSSPPKVGAAAPRFALPRLDGTGTLSLAALRGKAVVLNFWASWCVPCKAEAPVIERLWRRYKGQGVIFVGIDTNDASSDARRFVSAHGITYPVVVDKGGLVAANSYDIADLPVTYFVNRQGHLVGSDILGGVNKSLSSFRRNLTAAMTS
jgi:cytochrome c biogenesis protein CcmG, thiol:disulfide interchange protein DsbE